MSHGSKAGLLFAFAIAALPFAANAYPFAGQGAQGVNGPSPIAKAGCYYDCCDDCGWRPRWRYREPGYWRPHYWPGDYYHSRWRSHYRWGSYRRLWRPYEDRYGGGWD